MGVYDRQIETARRMIREKGEACSWLTAVSTADDAAKPWIEDDDDAPVATPVRIAFFPAKRQLQEMQRAMHGTEVIAGKGNGVMANTPGLAPLVGDRVRRSDGSMLSVASVDPVAPNGDVILYELRFDK